MTDLTRRSVALGAIAAPFLSLTGAHAQAKRKVTLTLSWIADGSNAYAYMARELGYFDEVGLDVQISRGYGSVAAAQAVGAGQFNFGLAAASSAIQQAAKGLPLVALAAFGYDATMAVCTLADNPAVKTVKDLAGHKIACTTSSGEYPFLPLFCERSGLDFKSLDINQADPNVRTRLLVSRQVDALSGFMNSTIPAIVYGKMEPRVFSFRQAGIRLYNYSLFCKPDLLRAEPKLCGDMTGAMLKALKYCMLEPDAGIKAFLKQQPELALTQGIAEQTRIGLGMTSVTALDDAAIKNGLGYMVPADYDSMTDLIMKYVASPSDPRPRTADLFSDTASSVLQLTPEEWAKAKTLAEPYRKYVG